MKTELLSALAALLVEVASPSVSAAESPASGGDAATRTTATNTNWFAIPVAFYTPETRLGFGGMGGIHFRFQPPLPTSDVQLVATGTARRQALLGVTTQLFPSEKLALGGALRLSRYPDFFYGIGNDTPELAKESFTSRSVAIHLSPEWFLLPGRLRAGPRAWFRQESFQGLAPAGQLASGAIPGIEDYASLGLGLGVTWDSRDSRFFPTRGNAVEVWYLLSPRLTEDGPRFGRGTLDVRQFLPLDHGLVLGVSGHLELAHGEVPLTLLPRLGGDSNLRGYYEGRWRDHFMYSGQAELRFPVVGRLGGAAFAGVSDVAARLSRFETRTIRPAGGVGARFRLTEDGLNVRLDVAAGSEGANVYFNLGEAF